MSTTSTGVEGSRETVAPLVSDPEAFRNDRKPCARCGIIRRQKPGRPFSICADCLYCLSKEDREEWRNETHD